MENPNRSVQYSGIEAHLLFQDGFAKAQSDTLGVYPLPLTIVNVRRRCAFVGYGEQPEDMQVDDPSPIQTFRAARARINVPQPSEADKYEAARSLWIAKHVIGQVENGAHHVDVVAEIALALARHRGYPETGARPTSLGKPGVAPHAKVRGTETINAKRYL